MYLLPIGNDSNDGLSSATPKKSIAWAFYTIAPDSINPKTIFLASGSIRNSSINYCHVTGDETILAIPILDAERDSTFVIENVSVTNCDVNYDASTIIGMIPCDNRNPIIMLKNILVANNASNGQSPIMIEAVTSNPALLTNCSFINNRGSSIAVRIIGNMDTVFLIMIQPVKLKSEVHFSMALYLI